MANYGDLSIDIEDLTANVSIVDSAVVGTGYLDKIMMTLNSHLKNEYESNRITGADYASVYLGMLQVALDKSVSILLNAKTSEQAAKAEAAKVMLTEAQTSQVTYQTSNILPKEIEKLEEEIDLLQSQDAELLATGIKDRLIKDSQYTLVTNQALVEATKKLLVERQISGFDDDAAQKLVKMVLDTWAVAFSVSEEAVSIPTSVTKDTIDSILKYALDNLGIVKTSNPLG